MAAPISLAKLSIYDAASSRSHTDIHVTHSDPRYSRRLIILIDFPRIPRLDQSYLIEAITKECDEWFHKSLRLEAEQALEKILDQLNYLLPHITPKKNPRWLEELNLLVAIIDGRDSHFANIGQMAAWLLHDNMFSLVSPIQKGINPLKLFSNSTSGDLNENDTLIFTSPTLTDYVSEVKIRQIIASGSTAEAVEKFELLLEQVPRFVSFAAIILKGQEEDALPDSVPVTRRVQPLRETLSAKRQPVPELRRSRPQIPRQKQTSTNIGSGIIGGMGWALKYFFSRTVDYFRLLSWLIVSIVKRIIKGFKFIFQPHYRVEASHRQWHRMETTVDRLHQGFITRHWTHRWLIIGSLIFVLIILNVIIYRGQGLQINRQQNTYSEQLAQLGNMQSDVDAARLYKDDKKAESILLQMLDILNHLTPQGTIQQQQLTDLRDKISRQINEVRHINALDQPLLYRDLTSLNQDWKHLVVINNIGYVSGANGIYRLDEVPKQIVSTPLNSGYIFNTSNNTLVVLNDRSIGAIVADKLQPAHITWNAGMQNIDQALLYSDNLYLVDKTSGSIYKHTGDTKGANYGNGAVWLKDASLIPSTQSIAIDGNIWLIDDQGSIIKLFKGQRQTFDYQRPLPAFGPGSQIMTSKDSPYLYVLDPTNKRVAIMDKTGSIKDQFTSTKFDNLKSFAVDSSEKIIYLLNGSQVYQVAITK